VNDTRVTQAQDKFHQATCMRPETRSRPDYHKGRCFVGAAADQDTCAHRSQTVSCLATPGRADRRRNFGSFITSPLAERAAIRRSRRTVRLPTSLARRT